MNIDHLSVWFLENVVIWYFLIINAGYIVLLLACFPDVKNYFIESTYGSMFPLLPAEFLPHVAVLLPMYNEEKHIVDSILSIMGSDYPSFELYVINDGSTDGSLREIANSFTWKKMSSNTYQLIEYPNCYVIDKEHSGKSDSLNRAIEKCSADFILTSDADSCVQPDTIFRLVTSALMHNNTVAEGGAVGVLNGCDYKYGKVVNKKLSLKWLESMQACEYLRSFLLGRLGWKHIGGNVCLAGALTMLRRDKLLDVNGFSVENRAEDLEMILSMHQKFHDKKIAYTTGYTPAAEVWTTVPSSLKALWKQRFRWRFYSVMSMMSHIKMLFNPRYGWVGIFGMPYFLFGIVLISWAELFAYFLIILGLFSNLVSLQFLFLATMVSVSFSVILTMAAILINKAAFDEYHGETLRFLALSLVEVFGYRQFLVVCNAWAVISYPLRFLLRRKRSI